MVCLIMFFCFHVRQSGATLLGMGAAIAGIAMLSLGDSTGEIHLTGLIFSLLSALSYAVYMVLLKVTSIQKLPATTLTFYALCFGLPLFLIALRGGSGTGEIAGSVQLLLCSRPGSLPFTVVISSHGGRHPFHRAG